MTSEKAEPRQARISDPQVMRALAHPARLSIMEFLSSSERGATATECAEIVGLSPSATSYHLRALAKFGLVEEAPGRGDARERLWRAFSQSYLVEPGQSAGSEADSALSALVGARMARDAKQTREWLRRAGEEPAEWYEATIFSDMVLLLTAEELKGLVGELHRLFEPYRRVTRVAETPTGARTVAMRFSAVPID